MTSPDKTPPMLNEETAQFIHAYVSVNLATRSVDNRPAVTRAYGVRVADDRAAITVFVARAGNQAILENIQSNQQLAVCFSRPTTNRTLQLKARDAELLPIAEADFAFITRYRQSMHEELRQLGFPSSFIEALIPTLSENDVAIRFTPLDAFIQTPGPDAGKKMPV